MPRPEWRCPFPLNYLTFLHEMLQLHTMSQQTCGMSSQTRSGALFVQMLPTKSRGVPRVDDRRVLNGIFWVLRSGAPWRGVPSIYGPRTTCYNRFVRWRRAGIWDRIMQTLTVAHDAAVQMIDTSMVRVHQHAACIADSGNQAVGQLTGRTDEQTACGRRRKGVCLYGSASRLAKLMTTASAHRC